MKKLIVFGLAVLAYALWPLLTAHADSGQPLIWNTPAGVFNLNLTTTEVGPGYDAINRQTLGFASLPVYTTPNNIATLQLGMDGAWPTGNSALVEPAIMAGHDILRDIPITQKFTSAHLNIFASWNTTGHGQAVRLGPNFTYAFGGSPAVASADPTKTDPATTAAEFQPRPVE